MKKLFEAAQLLFPVFLATHEEQLGGRVGIVLVIAETTDILSARDIVLGVIHEEKVSEKRDFAYEKVERLYERNKENPNELSSFASENVEEKKFGGGIKTKKYFLGASGLPPHLDQKFLISLCLLLNELNYTDALQIMEESFSQRKTWDKNADK